MQPVQAHTGPTHRDIDRGQFKKRGGGQQGKPFDDRREHRKQGSIIGVDQFHWPAEHLQRPGLIDTKALEIVVCAVLSFSLCP